MFKKIMANAIPSGYPPKFRISRTINAAKKANIIFPFGVVGPLTGSVRIKNAQSKVPPLIK